MSGAPIDPAFTVTSPVSPSEQPSTPPKLKRATLPLPDLTPIHDRPHFGFNTAQTLGLDQLATPGTKELLPALDFDVVEPGDGVSRNSEMSNYTNAQLYEMNEQLLTESMPTQPLISIKLPLLELRSEYENGSQTFLSQIDWLYRNGFTSIRRTRGDGDCFYRTIAFGYLERLLTLGPNLTLTALHQIESTRSLLETAEIEPLVYEDFMEELILLMKRIIFQGDSGMEVLTVDGLLKAFQTPEVSNAIVMYLRLLTSAYIKNHQSQYENFLVHPDSRDMLSVDEFCSNVVQAMGKEADNVEVDALCRALRLTIKVAYLDGRRSDGVDFIPFQGSEEANTDEGLLGKQLIDNPLVLLYRPGHYDLLM